MTNVIPVRPASRERIYDVIDGERDYQDAGEGNARRHSGQPDRLTAGEVLLCMEECMRKARTAWYKPGGIPAASDHLRKVVALGVQFGESYGLQPRANHVPESAGITGSISLQDPGDALKPADPAPVEPAPQPAPEPTSVAVAVAVAVDPDPAPVEQPAA